jgi:hypothetical protein
MTDCFSKELGNIVSVQSLEAISENAGEKFGFVELG